MGKIITDYHHGQNTLNFVEINIIFFLQQSRMTRNKNKIKTTFHLHPPFLPDSTSPPPPEQHRGTGNGSCGEFVTLCLSFSFHSLPLLQHVSFPRAAALHKLLNHGSFSWSSDLQERLLQRESPTGLQVIPENLLQCGLLSTAFCSCWEPSPAHTLHRPQLPSGWTHLLWYGVLHDLQVYIRFHHELQRDKLHHSGFYHGLERNFYSSIWSTSSPTFFTDLGVSRVVPVTYSHSSLTSAVQCFLPLLNTLSQRYYQCC